MELTRLFDVIDHQLKSFPQDDCLAAKESGEWKPYSTLEVKEISEDVSKGLLTLGVAPGDRIAIISPNRPEWILTDFGIQQIGAIGVPMYPTITKEDFKYIFEDAGVTMVFTGSEEIHKKAESAAMGNENIRGIYCFDKVEGLPHWSEVWKAGEADKATSIEPYRNKVKSADLLTIIYTSGTTGTPKGVMLTHDNVMSNLYCVEDVFPKSLDGPNAKALSFLPLCHIFERTASYVYMYLGISIYFAESMETIGDNIREISPNLFTCVPRLLEKVYDKIIDKGRNLTGLKKSLFFWAVNLGSKYEPHLNHGAWYNFQLSIANKLIFSKWREALGGKTEFIISGAAALQPRLSRIFWSAGIPILEGYGLTETSPGIAFSRMEDMRVGCVGPILKNIEVKIAEDGEILVKGPNVMKGYYKKPDLTAEVIDPEGYFHTGDVGELVDGKYLKITDRKKEIFKTSGGKYIAPQPIENKLKESLIIEQVMVVGEGEKHPSALILPSFEDLKKWCEVKGIPYSSNQEMVGHEHVVDKFQKELEAINEHFAQYERVKKFQLISDTWGIDTGELTPTLKLKRKIIHSKYQVTIEKFYRE